MTHKNVTAILASLVYIIEKVKSINVVFVTALSCLRLIKFFVFLCLFIIIFCCFCLLQCGLGVSDSDMHMSYLPLAHMYERLALVGKALTAATAKQRHSWPEILDSHAQNLGFARAKSRTRTRKISDSHGQQTRPRACHIILSTIETLL